MGLDVLTETHAGHIHRDGLCTQHKGVYSLNAIVLILELC